MGAGRSRNQRRIRRLVAARRGDPGSFVGCFADARPHGPDPSARLSTEDVERTAIAGAAQLLATATTHGQGTQAEVMLFQQLVRTAQSVKAMHAAVGEQRRAEQLRVCLEVRLEAVRTRLPALVGQPAIATELTPAQRAMGGVAPARPGSPLPTTLTPRPQVPTTPPERGAQR